jgi:hypothetical protein
MIISATSSVQKRSLIQTPRHKYITFVSEVWETLKDHTMIIIVSGVD